MLAFVGSFLAVVVVVFFRWEEDLAASPRMAVLLSSLKSTSKHLVIEKKRSPRLGPKSAVWMPLEAEQAPRGENEDRDENVALQNYGQTSRTLTQIFWPE